MRRPCHGQRVISSTAFGRPHKDQSALIWLENGLAEIGLQQVQRNGLPAAIVLRCLEKWVAVSLVPHSHGKYSRTRTYHRLLFEWAVSRLQLRYNSELRSCSHIRSKQNCKNLPVSRESGQLRSSSIPVSTFPPVLLPEHFVLLDWRKHSRNPQKDLCVCFSIRSTNMLPHIPGSPSTQKRCICIYPDSSFSSFTMNFTDNKVRPEKFAS